MLLSIDAPNLRFVDVCRAARLLGDQLGCDAKYTGDGCITLRPRPTAAIIPFPKTPITPRKKG